ncbi:MAG: BON domain-containing protein [Desulfovibrionaceae bacterium]
MKILTPLLLCLALLTLTPGCTVYKVAVDERPAEDVMHDERITFLIKEQFLEDDLIKYLDFDAASYLGHVYLIGEYESQAQADRAVSIARSTEGVKRVTTYLLPKQEVTGCDTAESLRIQTQLNSALLANDDVYGTNVDVKMAQCRVVLLGLVGSQHEIDTAVSLAEGVEGVRGVKSFLKVYPGK